MHGTAWAADPPYKDPSQPVEVRVTDLLGRMSLDEKIGQMTQAERKFISGAGLRDLRIGSVMAGGGEGPSPQSPQVWADLYDGFQGAALSTPLGIPMMFGIDAVHGANHIRNATIFPHNVGLGATRDPALVERIGRVTATEVVSTGVDWTYSPCVCVARDDHWGRVYESFGETPENPNAMTSLITGLQGASLNSPTSIMATAKHFVGDGGTVGGDDQGNTAVAEAELRAIHLPPFREAVQRNVASVMVSYSSWNGAKLHGNRYLLTDVLKGELGFGGIVTTDWDGIERVDGEYGFTPEDVRTAVNAGIDSFMITEQYATFIGLLRAEVQAGRVPMSRIDDANRRILRKKFELGLFERPYADRSTASTVGSREHRAVAREAVQKSQVVLKNSGILPLPQSPGKLFVAGKSADNIGFQSGGWTMKWQGADGPITSGTTVLQGIRNTVASGTTVAYDKDGNGIDGSYRAAIAVIGEKPYAEYEGDREDDLRLDAEDRAVLARLKASGVPVVTVVLSGRPLDVTAELPDLSALVAGWLPGTEGQGVADVLFGAARPTGKLPVSWARDVSQQPINAGDGKTALFPYGHGLTYDQVIPLPEPPLPGNGWNARDTIRAESYTGESGTQLEDCGDAGCGRAVAYISPGDHVYFDNVDFGGTSPGSVTARIASGASSGSIEYRLDSVTGPVVATAPVTPTGGWETWTDRTVPVTGATGKHRLYLVFTGPGGDFLNVNWVRFQ
ncbi:glycoside hydrolase family 3 protein [Actinoplanes sp. NBRC 103695]|uniref:glycoside hydrolase family 3 protein n=1 Tax=Actinoplanes sp. NBRC 103695 TaxID=3032202 RepID=UPI0024A3534E|nr:glycoside hydrolase family 3 protein [Actinoplanes sp. NBRC 103695]GLY92895.1 beta-glucosidase [Actinoplanes sp. NBRC 103695]